MGGCGAAVWEVIGPRCCPPTHAQVLPESSEELQERVAELLRQVRFSPHEHIVVVGHSLFIRELFRELRHGRASHVPSCHSGASHDVPSCQR